jgi:hypothetical protein
MVESPMRKMLVLSSPEWKARKERQRRKRRIFFMVH